MKHQIGTTARLNLLKGSTKMSVKADHRLLVELCLVLAIEAE